VRQAVPPRHALQVLFHHRWGPPLLAALHAGGGGAKFVSLVHRLGAPRDSVQRTLAALLEAGWVARNPGHGHPLRPEYLLTPAGEPLARACAELLEALREAAVEEVGLRKWSMPVVALLGHGPRRFSALKAGLATVSSRALALALKDLVEGGLVQRTVTDGYPPTVVYQLEASAGGLERCLARL
jgi:DNA-binding HxlR family transcriptional regulator